MFEDDSFFTWEIFLDGKKVGEQRYLKLITSPEEVKAVLIRDEGYDPRITVEKKEN